MNEAAEVLKLAQLIRALSRPETGPWAKIRPHVPVPIPTHLCEHIANILKDYAASHGSN